MTDSNLPKSTQKLVAALKEAGASDAFVDMARRNEFHDYLTSSATPIMDLVALAQGEGLHGIAEAARRGDFDAGPDDAWKYKPKPIRYDEARERIRRADGSALDAKGFVAYAKEYNLRGGTITKEEALDLVKQWSEQWPEIATAATTIADEVIAETQAAKAAVFDEAVRGIGKSRITRKFREAGAAHGTAHGPPYATLLEYFRASPTMGEKCPARLSVAVYEALDARFRTVTDDPKEVGTLDADLDEPALSAFVTDAIAAALRYPDPDTDYEDAVAEALKIVRWLTAGGTETDDGFREVADAILNGIDLDKECAHVFVPYEEKQGGGVVCSKCSGYAFTAERK